MINYGTRGDSIHLNAELGIRNPLFYPVKLREWRCLKMLEIQVTQGLKTVCPKCYRPAIVYHLDFESSQCRGPIYETQENFGIESPSHHTEDEETVKYEGCGEIIKKKDLLVPLEEVMGSVLLYTEKGA